MNKDTTKLSKFLSFVLRHKPETIGLKLDSNGWITIQELLTRSNATGTKFDLEELLHVVESSDKKRFSISADGLHIRAAQGHSVPVELGLSSQRPPCVLYHGTATQFVELIFREGLKPQNRQQVHLSIDKATARRVGQRHGEPRILKVDTLAMHANGFDFFLADNGVWLTDLVPSEFLSIISSGN